MAVDYNTGQPEEWQVTFTVTVTANDRHTAAQEARDYLRTTVTELPAKVRIRDPHADNNVWTHATEEDR